MQRKVLLARDWILSKVSSWLWFPFMGMEVLNLISCVEFVNSEDLYSPVKDALRSLNKVDIDKLIAAVRLEAC